MNLIPKQKGLVYYRTLPFNKINSFWLIIFLHYKYQFIGLVFIVPIFVAFLAATNLFNALYFLICIFVVQVILILIYTLLVSHIKSAMQVIFYYLSGVAIVFGVFSLLYFYTDYYGLFDPLFIFSSFLFIIPNWKSGFDRWDNFIKNDSGNFKQSKNKIRIINYEIIQKIKIPKISPLLAKEWLNYFRNPRYIRVLLLSFMIYILLLFLLYTKVEENFLITSSILTMLFIWQHFSLQFNEKYMKADSTVIIKTLPLKYIQLWSSKFLSELPFVFSIMCFLSGFWLVSGFGIADVFQLLLAIFLFSMIVLGTIINFKLIFYDRPRFAGYAYHFFIIFVAVMSANYYLVGPFIALILLIYFTFYSYREFAK
jgi:hypothetical protein